VRVACVSEVTDDLKIIGVVCEQRNTMYVGGRRERKVDGAPARLTAAVADGGRQTSPLASDLGCDRQRVEAGLDCAEALSTPRALVIIGCDKHAEVELRERRDAYRRLDTTGRLCRDQHRRVEQRTHPATRTGLRAQRGTTRGPRQE
jgi:hypothetical protein